MRVVGRREPFLLPPPFPSHLSSFIFFIFRSFFLRFKLDVVDIKLAISIRRPPPCEAVVETKRAGWPNRETDRRTAVAWWFGIKWGRASARGSQSYTFGCMGPEGDALISDLVRPSAAQTVAIIAELPPSALQSTFIRTDSVTILEEGECV